MLALSACEESELLEEFAEARLDASDASGLFVEECERREFERKSVELKGGKIAPKAEGAVVGEGDGIVGKNAGCVSVGECSIPPIPVRGKVGVRGEMRAVRFIASGTITERPVLPLRNEEVAEVGLPIVGAAEGVLLEEVLLFNSEPF